MSIIPANVLSEYIVKKEMIETLIDKICKKNLELAVVYKSRLDIDCSERMSYLIEETVELEGFKKELIRRSLQDFHRIEQTFFQELQNRLTEIRALERKYHFDYEAALIELSKLKIN